MTLKWSEMSRDERVGFFIDNRAMTYDDMAEKLSTTRSAVAGAMQRAGIRKGDVNPNVEKLAKNRAKHAERSQEYRLKFQEKKFRSIPSDPITSLPQVSVPRTSGPPRPDPDAPYRPLRIPFADRKNRQCSWGLWPDNVRTRHVPAADLVVCGAPVVHGGRIEWCPHHMAIGTKPLPTRVRR